MVGGIWYLWNSVNFNLNVMAKDNRAIHCHVIDKDSSKYILLTAVYAPAQERDKDVFWHHLNQLSNSITLSWCLMGNFNEMLCSSDKIGGAP